ncbi:MAG: hypothetical protein AAF311_04850 [Pseudomonadota bacterium]
MSGIRIVAWMLRGLSAWLVIIMFHVQMSASAHAHHNHEHDHAPADVCEVCIVAASDGEDEQTVTEHPFAAYSFLIETHAANPVSCDIGMRRVTTGLSPPRDPDRWLDAPRAPPR